MTDTNIRAFAATLAILGWAAAGGFVLWNLDLDPWWAAFVALVAIGILGLAHLLAEVLTRQAAATYLQRVEAEKLASVGEISDQELEEIEKVWTGPTVDIEPERRAS